MQPTAGGRGWYRGAQEFEDSAVAARIRHIVEPANEQNLDRLLSALAIPPGAARAGRCPDLGGAASIRGVTASSEIDGAFAAISAERAGVSSCLRTEEIDARASDGVRGETMDSPEQR